MNLKLNTMDKHLNLFFSYDQGHYKRPKEKERERLKQLEDNITRSLIVILKNIDSNTSKKVITKLLGLEKIKSTEISYDLQNTKYETYKKEKYLLIIQKEKSEISINSITRHNPENTTSNGNRPDGWIIGDKEVVLIESKVGSNEAQIDQIFRHITGNNGFGLNKDQINCSNIKILSLTWQKIAEIFTEQDIRKGKDKLLINEFLKYLSMAGQTLDFNYILDGIIDTQIHKDQLNLFLNELDKELEKKGLNLNRKKRAKHELWDFYGRQINGEVKDDPHYTIRFFDDCIQFYLTSKLKGQVNEILNKQRNKLVNYIDGKIQNIDKRILIRYYIQLINFRLVDHVQGQIRGDKYHSFYLNLRFSELFNKNNNDINEIIENFARFANSNNSKLYKQFELGISIDFFDFNKIKKTDQKIQVRKENQNLLKDPNSMIKLAGDFIHETYDLYEIMLSKVRS
jgi:hypothetical protein